MLQVQLRPLLHNHPVVVVQLGQGLRADHVYLMLVGGRETLHLLRDRADQGAAGHHGVQDASPEGQLVAGVRDQDGPAGRQDRVVEDGLGLGDELEGEGVPDFLLQQGLV